MLCTVLPDLVEIYFIMSFAGWLTMNRWLTVPEAPAMHVLWHDGDDAGESQSIHCVRGSGWTKRAGEGGGDILCRDLVARVRGVR